MEVETLMLILKLVEIGYDVIFEEDEDGTLVTWGTDTDGDGVPDLDVSDFFSSSSTDTVVEKSIIIMSSDGTMTVYDENGNITAEDCDTAYSLWVSDNGIMSKEIDNYSVVEGLLLIICIFTIYSFLRGLFKRRNVF